MPCLPHYGAECSAAGSPAPVLLEAAGAEHKATQREGLFSTRQQQQMHLTAKQGHGFTCRGIEGQEKAGCTDLFCPRKNPNSAFHLNPNISTFSTFGRYLCLLADPLMKCCFLKRWRLLFAFFLKLPWRTGKPRGVCSWKLPDEKPRGTKADSRPRGSHPLLKHHSAEQNKEPSLACMLQDLGYLKTLL